MILSLDKVSLCIFLIYSSGSHDPVQRSKIVPNFGRRHNEERSYKIFLNKDPQLNADISILQLWRPSCLAERNFKAIMLEDVMRNICVKLL